MLYIRRVNGDSMEPTLSSGSLVIFVRSKRRLKTGQIVMARVNGRELIKRIVMLDRQLVYLDGDNPRSKDYRVGRQDVVAHLRWGKIKL